MTFSVDKFERAQFAPRTQEVDVKDLAAFFDDGEKPIWIVRGLSSSELHRAMEAGKRQQSIEAIVKAIAQGADQAESVRKAIGLTTGVPGEIAERMEMLVMGSIAPKIELQLAVKLADSFPLEFLLLTNVIKELTGKGADMVKPGAASQPTTA